MLDAALRSLVNVGPTTFSAGPDGLGGRCDFASDFFSIPFLTGDIFADSPDMSVREEYASAEELKSEQLGGFTELCLELVSSSSKSGSIPNASAIPRVSLDASVVMLLSSLLFCINMAFRSIFIGPEGRRFAFPEACPGVRVTSSSWRRNRPKMLVFPFCGDSSGSVK
jgi:hypothetical protein